MLVLSLSVMNEAAFHHEPRVPRQHDIVNSSSHKDRKVETEKIERKNCPVEHIVPFVLARDLLI